MNAKDFFEKYNGQSIDDDGDYGVQCVDAFRVFCRAIGIEPYPTSTGWADGYWIDRADHADVFDFVEGAQNFRNGDWVVFPRGCAAAPDSHICMYYNGQAFGQRQQGNGSREFCLIDIDFSQAYGALRAKALEPDVPTYDGTDMTPVFELEYYKTSNPDVAAEYGDNAFQHFCDYGMNEHRQASADFNVDIYKNNYKDLQDAFSDDMPKYYVHYCQYGKNEGRNATSNIVAVPSFAPSKSCGTAVALFDQINVRTTPSTSDGLTGNQYDTSMALNFDSVVEGDGYYWLSYIADNGERHYCAYGAIDGSSKYWDIQ